MSLVGSLEDLGLGDILQIISLSGKSGVLVLRTESGEGRILFEAGLIRCAFTKGGPTELRELVAARGTLPADALAGAVQDAHSRGRPLAEVLEGRGLVSEEALDGIRRESIQATVFEMFGWSSGEFSFEVREVEDDGGGLFASPGINPQFLALEGTRRVDEEAHASGNEELAFGIVEDAPQARAEPEPPGEPEGPMAAADVVAQAVAAELAPAGHAGPVLSEADLVDPFAEGEAEARAPEAAAGVPEPEAVAEVVVGTAAEADEAEVAAVAHAEIVEEEAAREEAPEAVEAGPDPVTPTFPVRQPVILIDPSLPVLEWAKAALAGRFARVHIFQRTDLGMQRIRQYLARAEVPLVVLAADAPADPISGARNPFEVIHRLRRQSPRIPVALWVEESSEAPSATSPSGAPSGRVYKPSPAQLGDPRRSADRARLAEELAHGLAGFGGQPGRRGRSAAPDRELRRLREASARIREGASQGEVLPQVLAFASQTFSRVALFMIRDDRAIGIAQVGLPRAGGPDDEALRGLHLGSREAGWFRAVLDQRTPARSGPTDDGDQRLAVMLGNEIPDEVYVAPIESADRVVALLYGDNLPGREPIGDTGALEVVLDSAGIALDRALLERTLAESEA